MNNQEEPEREIEALWESISRLSAANLRISESSDLETVLREALESLRQGVHQLPPLGCTPTAS
ncbi:MAG: hypothetical protein OXI69_16155 [Acidobacteriota bacterium]|nr:hypothetical protein [Acidobacteriota bacterium]